MADVASYPGVIAGSCDLRIFPDGTRTSVYLLALDCVVVTNGKGEIFELTRDLPGFCCLRWNEIIRYRLGANFTLHGAPYLPVAHMFRSANRELRTDDGGEGEIPSGSSASDT